MYRKIDIDYSAQLIIGRLERRNVCACNFSFVKEDVPIGKEYTLDLKSVRWAKFQCFGCGKTSEVRVIDVWEQGSKPTWTVLDLLDLDRAIPFMPKPDHWMPVKENKVLPKKQWPGGGILIP